MLRFTLRRLALMVPVLMGLSILLKHKKIRKK